jgi:hypothetical protein
MNYKICLNFRHMAYVIVLLARLQLLFYNIISLVSTKNTKIFSSTLILINVWYGRSCVNYMTIRQYLLIVDKKLEVGTMTI